MTIIIAGDLVRLHRRARPAVKLGRQPDSGARPPAHLDVNGTTTSRHRQAMSVGPDVAGGKRYPGQPGRGRADGRGRARRSRAAADIVYFCSHRHETGDGVRGRRRIPGVVGLPAVRSAGEPRLDNPPPPPKIEPYKTHLAYVKERRSDQEAEDILDEASRRCAPGASPARSSSRDARHSPAGRPLRRCRPARRSPRSRTPARPGRGRVRCRARPSRPPRPSRPRSTQNQTWR